MSGDWTNIPIGVGIAVLLVREVSRFIQEQRKGSNGTAGSKSVEFWDAKIHEAVYTEIDRHVLPLLRDSRDRQVSIDQHVRELRWRHGRQDRKDD